MTDDPEEALILPYKAEEWGETSELEVLPLGTDEEHLKQKEGPTLRREWGRCSEFPKSWGALREWVDERWPVTPQDP